MDKLDFLVESYKSLIEIYNDYLNRIWSRFSILLTVDAALAGIFISKWFEKGLEFSSIAILIPILGLILSMLLYFQSAQDRFIIRRFRFQLKELRIKITKFLDIEEELSANCYPFMDEELEKKKVFEDLTSWRCQLITVTRLPAISSISSILFWIAFFIILIVI